MGNSWYAFIKSILRILLKSYTQNYHHTSLRKRTEIWEVFPTTLLNLPQNWVIRIEKGGTNNFAQVIKILGNFVLETLPINKKILMKYQRLKFSFVVI